MNFVTSISLVVLGAMFLALLGWGSIRAAWRNCEGRRGVFAALAILAAICSIVAQKPSPDTPTITVDALLRDVGCYATNNVFHAAVTNAPSYAGVDFSDCDLMVYARERASSDAASWFELTPRKKFSQQPADYAIENATNFNYMVYLNYVPPSPVHTNGVFELYGFVIENEAQGEPDQLAAGFINSRAFLAPPTARDYIQDGLVAMWDGIENAGWGVHDACATVWKDLIGGYDATRVNAKWGDKYAQFDGVGNDVAKTGSLLGKPSNATLEVVYSRGNQGNGCMAGCTQVGGFSLWYNNDTQIDYWARGYGYPLRLSANDRNDGLIHSRSTTMGSIEIAYYDAVQIGTYGGSAIVYNNNCGFNIGADSNGTQYGIEYPFIGKIYCVRIYSRALSTEEIEHNYKIDKRRFNQ